MYYQKLGHPVGYLDKEGSVIPQLEEDVRIWPDRFVTMQIQKGALQFLEDYYEKFSDYEDSIEAGKECAMPFEFLVSENEDDRKMFHSSYFEDEVWGEKKDQCGRLCKFMVTQRVMKNMKLFIKNACRYSYFIFYSARADLRAEVANSYLNWFWWILEPFLDMCVYTFVFGTIFHASEPNFPIFIFSALIMWNYFSKTVNQSVKMIRSKKRYYY